MKKSFKVFSRVMAISFAILILINLSACGSTSCTTRSGNYNTVR